MSSSYDSPYSLCIFRRRAALLRFSRSLLYIFSSSLFFFFFQAEDGIRDWSVTWSSDVCSSDLLGATLGSRLSRLRQLAAEAAAVDALVGRRPAGVAQSRPPSPRRGSRAGDRPRRPPARARSEERRVGKECRSRVSTDN